MGPFFAAQFEEQAANRDEALVTQRRRFGGKTARELRDETLRGEYAAVLARHGIKAKAS